MTRQELDALKAQLAAMAPTERGRQKLKAQIANEETRLAEDEALKLKVVN